MNQKSRTISLKLKGLTKSIGGARILSGIEARFWQGTTSGLVGPNGAGKTTLFHLITGELRPDTGNIIYNDKSISGISPYRVAREGVGRLFQDVRIFGNLTVYENILSACQNNAHETPWYPFLCKRTLKKLQHRWNDHVSHWSEKVGLSAFLDAKAGSLSYGQQKLLALARILAGDFSLLLLDEPTAGLSPQMVTQVIEILNEIVSEDSSRTVILVEHDMSVISEIADWVYFMNEGKISFFGKTDHVLGHKEVREIYLGF